MTFPSSRQSGLLESCANFLGRRAGLLATIAALLAVVLVGWPQMQSSFEASLRYSGQKNTEWAAVDYWLESAKCARRTGVLLAVCEGDRLLPISDRSLADDPGHAFLLGILARIAGRDVDLVDVARVNLCINAMGLALIAALMLSLRLYGAGLLLLWLGPSFFLQWFGLSPHWSFYGLTLMQAVLPLALIARERDWMPRPVSNIYVGLGFVALVLAGLVREAVATMALIVLVAVVGWIAFERLRRHRPVMSLAVVMALAVGASHSASLAIAGRDMFDRVEPAQHIGTHGMAHTLYISLGSVPNRLGIQYSDEFGIEAARKVDPNIKYQSAEYLGVMRGLYVRCWLDDPLEVARIYFVKFKSAVGYWILGKWALPLWGSLPLLIAIHLASNGGRLTCGEQRCDTRLAVNLVAMAFVGLIVLQSVVAMPSQFYAMPSGPLLALMIGVAMENVAGALWRAVRRVRSD